MATTHSTAPHALKAVEERSKLFLAATTLQVGVATKYWLELLAYPPGSARSLWLFVDNNWKHLDNPNDGTQISVQNAFCNCPDRLEVAVWYINDVIVGLVSSLEIATFEARFSLTRLFLRKTPSHQT